MPRTSDRGYILDAAGEPQYPREICSNASQSFHASQGSSGNSSRRTLVYIVSISDPTSYSGLLIAMIPCKTSPPILARQSSVESFVLQAERISVAEGRSPCAPTYVCDTLRSGARERTSTIHCRWWRTPTQPFILHTYTRPALVLVLTLFHPTPNS
jgi:hypothetical protein